VEQGRKMLEDFREYYLDLLAKKAPKGQRWQIFMSPINPRKPQGKIRGAEVMA
jgi:hypothetical protein